MSEPGVERHTIPVARYAFVVKEGAAGEPRIVLDLKAAPNLEVLGDGRLGFELVRPEIAPVLVRLQIARELARRLNAAVRLVGYRPQDESERPPSRSPGPGVQRAEYAFRAASGAELGDQWIAAWPVGDGLPILAGGSIGFLLQPGATADEAAELAWGLNAAVKTLAYWALPRDNLGAGK
jgi:hypothetical protein